VSKVRRHGATQSEALRRSSTATFAGVDALLDDGVTEVLLEAGGLGGRVVALGCRGPELVATADLHVGDPHWDVIVDAVQVVSSDPLVVAGRLPEGAVDVRVLWPGDWASVHVRGPGWLAVAEETPASEGSPIWALAFTLDDGSTEPVPDPEEPRELAEPLEIGEPNPEALAYGAALATAIAADIASDRLAGPLRRIVVRWFWNADPTYLTIHALAAGDPQPYAEDAWYPLEWDVSNREFERTERVLAAPAVQQAVAALTASFERLDDDQVDDLAHVPAVLEAVRRLPDSLATHAVPVADRFAVAAAHFEGWGLLQSLRATAPSELLAALEAHDELPVE
jgi:hypothetical protein